MRTFPLPNLICASVIVGSVLLLGAAATGAAETGSSSVNFVDRGALKSNGWTQSQGNPLRRNTNAAGQPIATKAVREAVAPAENGNAFSSPRGASGLQLRPHTPETGIFSSWFGETAKAKPDAAKAQPQSPSQSKPMPPKTAAARAMGMMPQFMSPAGKKQGASAASPTSTVVRAGSAQQRIAQQPPQYGANHAATQASYGTAARQAYRSQGIDNTPGEISVQRQTARVMSDTRLHSIPTPIAQAAPTTKPGAAANTRVDRAAVTSSTAELLANAHQMAELAKTEADFTQIFELCGQIPASKATKEETAFGRQLAAWSLNRRGQLRARAGNTDGAMDDFNLAVRIDAACWRALHNRGVLLAQAGQFEQAFDDFHQTIELNPSFAKAHSNRAALYVLAGELEPALGDYQRAIELDPEFAIAQRGCGRTCHMLGRTDEALEHLTRAIELAPKDAAALASRGDLLTDLGRYSAAESDYERALAVNANHIDACRGSAWLLATCPEESVRNPDLALRRAQLAMQLDHKADVVTLDTLAAAQASTGDFEAAMQTVRHAIDLAPPSERSVYQDRLQMYRHSTPFRIAPLQEVQQAGYEQ
jgi:tetratricopeptide (TPR) repeat protein